MRETLTGLALALCLALIAAMVGPYFIDWNKYRPNIAKNMAKILGQEVEILGNINLRLLPTPYLDVDNFRIGNSKESTPIRLDVQKLTLSLSPSALLSGEIRVADAVVLAPKLIIREQNPAQVSTLPQRPPARFNEESIALEHFRIKDGSFSIENSTGNLSIDGIDAEIDATSLAGPMRGSGSLRLKGEKQNFRFALGKNEGGLMKVKTLLESEGRLLRGEIEGMATLGAAPKFEGSIALSGNPVINWPEQGRQQPFSGGAKLSVNREQISLNDIALNLGTGFEATVFTGETILNIAAEPRFSARLNTRQLDLNPPRERTDVKRLTPVEAIKNLGTLLQILNLGVPPKGELDFSIDRILLDNDQITGFKILTESNGKVLRLKQLSADMLGDTKLRLEKIDKNQPGALFANLSLTAQEPLKFTSWFLSQLRPKDFGNPININGIFSTTGKDLTLTSMIISTNSARFDGDFQFLPKLQDKRPADKMTLHLQGDRLDLAALSFLNANNHSATANAAPLDFDVMFETKKVVYNNIEGGKLTAKLRRDGEITSVERLAIDNIGGASLIGSGILNPNATKFSARIAAEKLTTLSQIVDQYMPGIPAQVLRNRAEILSPAQGVVDFSSQRDGAREAIDLKLNLDAGGTNIKGVAQTNTSGDGAISLNLSLENPSASRLLQQIAAAERKDYPSGEGKLNFSATGTLRRDIDTSLTGKLAGTDVQLFGKLTPSRPLSPFEGNLNIEGRDAQLFSNSLGGLMPGLPKDTPLKIESVITGAPGKIALRDLKAQIADNDFKGEIAFNINDSVKIAGQIRTKHVSFPFLSSLATGGLELGKIGNIPQQNSFLTPPNVPFSGDLWIEAEEAKLDSSIMFQNPRFVFRFDTGLASFDHFDAQYAGGRLGGDITLRRNGQDLTMIGRLRPIEWQFEKLGSTSLSGRLTSDISINAGGKSFADLIANLSGAGTARLSSMRFNNFDPLGLLRLHAQPIAQLQPIEPNHIGRRLQNELNTMAWQSFETSMPVSIINGIMRFGPAKAQYGKNEGNQVSLDGTGLYDFKKAQLEARLTVSADLNKKTDAAKASRPNRTGFNVEWRGNLSEPTRQISIDALLNNLLGRAIETDLEKANSFEADMRERSSFNRRFKLLEGQNQEVP